MGRESTPGRTPRVSDQDILAVFREASEPVLSTRDVADALPIKRRATHDRLNDLVETGGLARKRIGKSTVYWLPGHTETPTESDSPAGRV